MDTLENIERFATSKLAIGLAPATVEWYEWMIQDYLSWARDRSLPECVTESIELFLAAKRRGGAAGATVASYWRALSVYFAWMVQRKLLAPEANPMLVIPRPRVPRKRVKYVSVETFKQLFHTIDGRHWTDARDRAALLILFYSGLRIGELLALHREDINTQKRIIRVDNGKGGHDRDVPCAPTLAQHLDEYLRLLPASKRDRLWLGSDGAGGVRGPLTIDGIRQMVRRRFRQTGLPYQRPHAFRHGFAMTMLNAGMDLSAVSAALGHESVKTTQDIYAYWLTGGLQREYDEAYRRL